MKYREDKYGQKISCLGFGCMRLTHKGREIDFEATQEQICKAVELGINYFDTAYFTPAVRKP
ncbi:MAG: aldo/keto reductase [Solobacterium sp.]|nr:aldo/keto reductase [Solobacterium sp.]